MSSGDIKAVAFVYSCVVALLLALATVAWAFTGDPSGLVLVAVVAPAGAALGSVVIWLCLVAERLFPYRDGGA